MAIQNFMYQTGQPLGSKPRYHPDQLLSRLPIPYHNNISAKIYTIYKIHQIDYQADSNWDLILDLVLDISLCSYKLQAFEQLPFQFRLVGLYIRTWF